MSAQRTSSNAFDRAKFAELLLYIIDRVESPADLGPVKLQKTVWFADLAHFADYGRSIAGASYVRAPQGPICPWVDEVLRGLESDGSLAERRSTVFGRAQRQFFSLRRPKLDFFSGAEISAVERALDFVLPLSARQISDLSHSDVWQHLSNGDPIPLEVVFSDQRPDGTTLLGHDLPDERPDVLEWALGAIDEAELDRAGRILHA